MEVQQELIKEERGVIERDKLLLFHHRFGFCSHIIFKHWRADSNIMKQTDVIVVKSHVFVRREDNTMRCYKL